MVCSYSGEERISNMMVSSFITCSIFLFLSDSRPLVMISYQWDAQDRMLKLKDELIKAGYRIWMDVEKMGMESKNSNNVLYGISPALW